MPSAGLLCCREDSFAFSSRSCALATDPNPPTPVRLIFVRAYKDEEWEMQVNLLQYTSICMALSERSVFLETMHTTPWKGCREKSLFHNEGETKTKFWFLIGVQPVWWNVHELPWNGPHGYYFNLYACEVVESQRNLVLATHAHLFLIVNKQVEVIPTKTG